jgi:hypothetical protein
MGKNQDPGSGINIPDPQHCLYHTRGGGPDLVGLMASNRQQGPEDREEGPAEREGTKGQEREKPADGNGRRRQSEHERQGERVRNRGGEQPSSEKSLKTLKILYANAQSIASKPGELAATAKDLQPDLILLCETWCNDTVSNASLSIQ